MRRKRSQRVELTLVTALAAALTAGTALTAAGCGGSRSHLAADPCEPETFDDGTCQSAVRDHGYFYQGQWVPHYYTRPYGWYVHSSSLYSRLGGAHHAFSSSRGARGSSSASHGISRGGFGSHGAAHASAGS